MAREAEEFLSSGSDSEDYFSSSDMEDNQPVETGRKALMAAYSGQPRLSSKPAKSAAASSSKADASKKEPVFRNKQRVLLLCSRGTTQRYRHLMKDLESLLPHSKKDSKFDSKGDLGILNEIAELSNCNNTLYLETKKNQDLYMWLAKTPHGPSYKFLVQNVHTMDELKMTGNCLKGSRPILSFDKAFDGEPQLQLMKEMLVHTFGTPKGHRKSKPFFDHVFSFSLLDGRIWFRNYQIIDDAETGLVEIGPRFCMNPIVILSGAFGGPVMYDNEDYVSPNAVRAEKAKVGAGKYTSRIKSNVDRQRKLVEDALPRTELTEVDELFKN